MKDFLLKFNVFSISKHIIAQLDEYIILNERKYNLF